MAMQPKKFFQPPKITLPRLLIGGLILGVVTASGNVSAKYVTDVTSAPKQVTSASFCFLTSLAENTAESPYLVYDGDIQFTVKNHDALNTSSHEIQYTVTVTGPDSEASSAQEEAKLYTLPNTPDGEHLYTHHVSEDGDYQVTLTSTAPFKKTITLYFRVKTHFADSFYTIDRHEGWMEVDVYTGQDQNIHTASASSSDGAVSILEEPADAAGTETPQETSSGTEESSGSASSIDNNDITIHYGTLAPYNALPLMETWSAGTLTNPGIATLTNVQPYTHYHLVFFGEDPDNDLILTQNDTVLSVH